MEDNERLARAYKKAQIAREERGLPTLTQTVLAKELGITQTAVSKLMTGSMEIPITRVIDLADALECPVSDISPAIAAQLEAAAQGLTVTSKIAYKKAKLIAGTEQEVADIIKHILAGKAPQFTEFEHCGAEHSDSTYAIKVHGEAMLPLIAPGTIAFVDYEAEPEAGKPCCLLKGNKVVFATWTGDGYARYENPEYPDRVFTLSKKDAVIGKVVEIRSRF